METEKITSTYRKSVGETQTMVDVMIQKNDAPIGKVLVANAVPCVEQFEMLNGEATYSGNVEFCLVYADTEGEVFSVNENTPLRGKIENIVLNPLMKPIYDVEVVECKVNDVDNMAKITATVAIKLDVIENDEVFEVKPADENIELKSETERHLSIVSSGEKTITLSEQFESKEDVQSVVMALAKANVKTINAGKGYFSVDGNVFVNALLKVKEDEITTIKNFMETLDFAEELEDDNVQKDDIITAFCYVRPQDIKVEVLNETNNDDQSEASQTISTKVDVTIKYVVMREVEREIYTDAFSMTNKTNISYDTLIKNKLMKTEKLKTTIEGQTNLDESRIAKVCAVINENVLVASTKLDGGTLFVEGIAGATVLYLTDDDMPKIESVELEVPFSNKFEVADDLNGNLFVVPHIVDVEAKARKGKEITVSMDVCFDVDVYETESCAVIKDIELTEELPTSEYSLEIYIAPKGSTLWDVSKHLLVSEEVLLKQNPNLVFPLENSQSIVHFVQK